MFPSSRARKENQGSTFNGNNSNSSLAQIQEDKPSVAAASPSPKAAGRAIHFKKFFDAFHISDASLDHSSDGSSTGGDGPLNNSFSSGLSAVGSSMTGAIVKKKKSSKGNNVERWAEDQQMNLQTGSSTRWVDNDKKSRPRGCWD